MADRPLHIGVDGRELFGQPTGVGRYLAEILRAWAADPAWPHRLTIFAAADPGETVRALCPRASWAIDAAPRAGTWWEQMRLPRAARARGIDVLFAPAYTAPLRLTCPFVLAVHDVSFFAHPEWFSPRERIRRQWLTRRAAMHATEVLTLSEFSAREIARYLHVDAAKLRLAPPGVPAPDEARTDASRSAGAGAHAADPPLVLSVGSLFNRRHIPELLTAFARVRARVPDARLALVGDNRTRPRIDPMAIARDLGIGAHVDWRRYVPDGELARLYASARVFVFLSDYEGFAMTPFEAMAHGAAVVMLDTAVAREVQGAGAVLVPLDPDAVAQAIVRLLTDDDARRAQVAAGDERLPHYSWPRTAAVVRDALERAAGGARRRTPAAGRTNAR